ncbi:MAG: hypothetical protein R3A48_05730 [Polyangiales bacterium]
MSPRALSLAAAVALLGCGAGGTSRPFPDVGPMDAALRFDVLGFDVIRADRAGMTRPEVLDFTDADLLPGQLDVSRMDRPCATELPGEYRFFTQGATASDDKVFLSLPRRFRFERRLPGVTTPAVCETTIPACGAADAVDVDELDLALTDPEVVAALAPGERAYGCDARMTGGAALVVERGAGRAVLGDPCRVCAPMACTPPPMGLQRLSDVLVALRDQELLRPGCRAVVSADAGAALVDAPVDAPRDVAADDAPDASVGADASTPSADAAVDVVESD